MAQNSAVTKFHDRAINPPRGQWHFTINGQLITRYTESDILQELRAYHRNNGTYTNEAALEQELWNYYCSREPARCANGRTIEVGVRTWDHPGPVVPADRTPEIQGPPIWTFLNTLAAAWTAPLHNYFLDTCDAIVSILECPICRDEYRKLLQNDPPINVSSRLEACRLVNHWHNKVNTRLGKRQYPYERMVAEFGAPLP